LNSETQRLWYIRLAEQVRGPFPTQAVVQDLALGRLPPEAEFSNDRVSWTRAVDTEAFSRLTQADPSDGWAEERRRAFERWADERQGPDRRSVRRPTSERRRNEGSERPRAGRDARPVQQRWWLVFATLAALLLSLLALAWLLGPGSPPAIKLLK
jgi:hypothetical protein